MTIKNEIYFARDSGRRTPDRKIIWVVVHLIGDKVTILNQDFTSFYEATKLCEELNDAVERDDI